jgi:ribosomal protein S18
MPLNRSSYSRFSFTRTNGDAEQGQESMNSNYQPSIFLKSYNHNEQIQSLDQSDVSKVDESVPSNNKVDKKRATGKEKKRQKQDAKARNDNFSEQTVELLQGEIIATITAITTVEMSS